MRGMKTGNDKSIYDREVKIMPEPTALYSLGPIGIGTYRVESLTTYLGRLAQAHHVTVGKLLD